MEIFKLGLVWFAIYFMSNGMAGSLFSIGPAETRWQRVICSYACSIALSALAIALEVVL